MLTDLDHQQILNEALSAAVHGDGPRLEAAVKRVFGPGTDSRDGYVIVSGALSVMLRDVPPPGPNGTAVPMIGVRTADGDLAPTDLEQAPPIARTVARMMAAAHNDDGALSWALWDAVVMAGPRQIVEFVVAVIVHAARTVPCRCGGQ